MNYLAIILGLLLGLVPSLGEAYNSKKGKLTKLGILLIFLAVLFIISSISSEVSNSKEIKKKNTIITDLNMGLDSLQKTNSNLNFKMDSLKLEFYVMRDSIFNINSNVLSAENNLYRSIYDFRKQNEKAQKINIKLLEKSITTEIIGNEPNISSDGINFNRKNENWFEYDISFVNNGKRQAYDIKFDVKFFIFYHPKGTGELTLILLPSNKNYANVNLPGGRSLIISSKFKDAKSFGGNEYMYISYTYKDKLQNNKVLSNEYFFRLNRKNSNLEVEYASEDEYKKIKKHLK